MRHNRYISMHSLKLPRPSMYASKENWQRLAARKSSFPGARSNLGAAFRKKWACYNGTDQSRHRRLRDSVSRAATTNRGLGQTCWMPLPQKFGVLDEMKHEAPPTSLLRRNDCFSRQSTRREVAKLNQEATTSNPSLVWEKLTGNTCD